MDRVRIRRFQRALRLAVRRGGAADVYLAGVCMAPLLAPGSRIHLEDRPPRRGEVVIYETEAGWLAHRVVGVGEGELLIRPDRPGSGVERVARERVVGTWVPTARQSAPRTRLALAPSVGRAVQRASTVLSGPRVFPILRGLRRNLRTRLPGPRDLTIRQLDRPGSDDLAGLSALGLWGGAVVSETAGEGAPITHFWILEGGGRARGGLALDQVEQRGLVHIVIEPNLHGRGHGRALLQAAIQWARAEGLASVDAEIARDNVASRRLFQKAGFVRIATKVAVSFQRGAVLDAYRLDLGADR